MDLLVPHWHNNNTVAQFLSGQEHSSYEYTPPIRGGMDSLVGLALLKWLQVIVYKRGLGQDRGTPVLYLLFSPSPTPLYKVILMQKEK